MGYSDPGPSPRTARRIARELAQLLDHSGISGPVVLVGASIGGFAVRVFASEQAERVAGLVLVELRQPVQTLMANEQVLLERRQLAATAEAARRIPLEHDLTTCRDPKLMC